MVRDGWIMMAPLGVVMIVCLVLMRWSESPLLVPLASVSGLGSVMVGLFFRDPERTIPEEDGLILSAADGKVVAIQELDDEPFVGGRAVQISVFLSLLNVHVNRMPLPGIVRSRQYIKGRFLLAHKRTASQQNEQIVLGVESPYGRVVVKQIVGFLARRIVCRVQEGQSVQAGERIGLIRFGSRVDVIVPIHATITARVGMTVRGGETILGVLR